MVSIANYLVAKDLDEAYSHLMKHKNNTLLGGCLFLKMSSKNIPVAIDLHRLNLNYMNDEPDCIEIGAMTTLRDIENSALLRDDSFAALHRAASEIMGVQFRNLATMGGNVFSKYGFSDIITPLLALDAEVELYHAGKLPLDAFLKLPVQKDILTKIYLKKQKAKTTFLSFRRSGSDFSVLNVAVSKNDKSWKIAVGARPGRASLALQAADYLGNSNLEPVDIANAAEIASNELPFGSNMRASAAYRKNLCTVLVKRAVMEVLK